MKNSLNPIEQFLSCFEVKDGRTLIVGSKLYEGREDRRLKYQDVIGIDMEDGLGVDRVLNLENRLPNDIGKFDHIECCSVLEHSKKPWLLAANLERLLVPQGTIFLEAPFMWRVHSYPDDYFRFTLSGLKLLFPNMEWLGQKYLTNKLCDKPESTKVNGHPYFARTECLLFGVKK